MQAFPHLHPKALVLPHLHPKPLAVPLTHQVCMPSSSIQTETYRTISQTDHVIAALQMLSLNSIPGVLAFSM